MIPLLNFEGNAPFEVYFKCENSTSSLNVEYLLKGNIESIDLSKENTTRKRVIGLWKKTCFELFIKNKNTDDYFEFNFAPNTDWNLFHFLDIRSELKEFKTTTCPLVKVKQSNVEFQMQIIIPKQIFPDKFISNGEMMYSPTSIIHKSSHIYHFASIHPDNKLDFHRYQSFDQSL
ncbi:MAG: hypothetical protein HN576_12250 [Bacteriovoracaceae bacterium]|jgi:hypothetical protein|nr:hypothetical protein [Bacteriovoracaceae bacterium]